MRKALPVLLLSLALTSPVLSQKTDFREAVNRYLLRFRDIAVYEMKIAHIPASITLAQGILESNAGQSALAKEANNHFGIKCHKDWSGPKYFQDDDKPNECFRKYSDPEESFRDHSSFLVTRDRYRALFKLEATDYKGWARGLKNAGYATNPAYADLLIRTIEKYQLYRFDTGDRGQSFVDSLSGVPKIASLNPWAGRFEFTGLVSGNHKIYRNNHVLLTIAEEGDDLASLSRSMNISAGKIRRYNDMDGTRIRRGDIIYLGAKRRKAAVSTHRVKEGETILEISQGYAIKLKVVLRRNGLRRGVEPAAGTLLRLR